MVRTWALFVKLVHQLFPALPRQLCSYSLYAQVCLSVPNDAQATHKTASHQARTTAKEQDGEVKQVTPRWEVVCLAVSVFSAIHKLQENHPWPEDYVIITKYVPWHDFGESMHLTLCHKKRSLLGVF